MIHLAIITAVILSAFIEGIRIEGVKGKVFNVKKWVSVLIGAALFGVVLLIFGLEKWYFVIAEMVFVRATLYDPVLNRLRGLKWDYISEKTNSRLDKLEGSIKAYIKRRFKIELTFMSERIFYGIISLSLILLYEFR